MKMVTLIAVKEFDADIKKIFFNAGITEFTCVNATGCRDTSTESLSNNWFAEEINEVDSMVYWLFIPGVKISTLETGVLQFNAGQESQSKIHLFISPIEKSI